MKTAVMACVLMVASAAQSPLRFEGDIAYVPGAGAGQRLDLHLPDRPGFDTVVFLHGGSLQESGERRDSPMYARVCPALAAAGIACAAVDYRLAPAAAWPAMAEDAAAALAWVKRNIAARGGDPAKVFVFGHSSGCQLAAGLGANARFLAAQGLGPADVAGIVAMGCVLAPSEDVLTRYSMDDVGARWRADSVYRTLEDWLDADASRFLGAHMPPTLVIVAHRERFFPAILEQGAKFARRMLELERPADVVIVPGGHIDSISGFGAADDPVLAAVLDFIRNPSRMPPN